MTDQTAQDMLDKILKIGAHAPTVEEQAADLYRMAQQCDAAAEREMRIVRQALDSGDPFAIAAAQANLNAAAARIAAAKKWRTDVRDLYRRNDRCQDCGAHIAESHELECSRGDWSGFRRGL